MLREDFYVAFSSTAEQPSGIPAMMFVVHPDIFTAKAKQPADQPISQLHVFGGQSVVDPHGFLALLLNVRSSGSLVS